MSDRGFIARAERHRWAFEPALALAIALIWSVAAAVAGSTFSFLSIMLFALAVSLSRLLPPAALAVGAVATLAALGSLPGEPARSLLWVSACLVTWGACLYGRARVLRYMALGVAVAVGALTTVLLAISVTASGYSTGPWGTLHFFSELGVDLALGFLATAVLVGGWTFALVLRRRAERRADALNVREPADPPSAAGAVHPVETWLMDPPPSDWLNTPAPLLGGQWFRPLSRSQVLIDAAISGTFFLFAMLSDPREDILSLVVVVGFTAALLVRRLSPGLALTLAWATALGQMLAGLPVLTSDIAVLGVLFVTAAYADRFVRWAGLVSVGVGALLAAGYLSVLQRAGSSADAGGRVDIGGLIWSAVATLIASLAVLGLSWTLGLLMRTWQTARDSRVTQYRAVEEQKLAQRNVVVEQERNRIARDMHDVVAHSLAVVIAQADGARYARLQNPETVDEALSTISTTAREALSDVRILLTRLRQDDAAGPQPVLADLDRLVAQMRGTGLDIEWTTTGPATTLGSGAQLAVYRIVQEALTNALRHGDPDRAVYLSLNWTDGWVAVTIDNAVGATPVSVQSDGIGHGLPGMRERALLAGGSLAAESIGGRFIVAARLPAITTNALTRPAAPLHAGRPAAAAGAGE